MESPHWHKPLQDLLFNQIWRLSLIDEKYHTKCLMDITHFRIALALKKIWSILEMKLWRKPFPIHYWVLPFRHGHLDHGTRYISRYHNLHLLEKLFFKRNHTANGIKATLEIFQPTITLLNGWANTSSGTTTFNRLLSSRIDTQPTKLILVDLAYIIVMNYSRVLL